MEAPQTNSLRYGYDSLSAGCEILFTQMKNAVMINETPACLAEPGWGDKKKKAVGRLTHSLFCKQRIVAGELREL